MLRRWILGAIMHRLSYNAIELYHRLSKTYLHITFAHSSRKIDWYTLLAKPTIYQTHPTRSVSELWNLNYWIWFSWLHRHRKIWTLIAGWTTSYRKIDMMFQGICIFGGFNCNIWRVRSTEFNTGQHGYRTCYGNSK